jgi:riboflavin biosynthesis pyrimidine reductase
MNTQTETIEPLDSLYDDTTGIEMPIPPELAHFYGTLRFPEREDRPYVIANLVTSLDGVVTLGIPGKAGGKEISGSSLQDRALMGILRAVADAVVEGAGTLREGEGRALTAASIYPPLADAYAALRAGMKKEGDPLAVIVTASGDIDPSMPVFKDGKALVVTTHEGAKRLREVGLPAGVRLAEVETTSKDGEGHIPGRAILDLIAKVRECSIVLVEGGPHLLGDFFAEGAIDEQFLTLSPQVVGRDNSGKRLGLVEGQTFAPDCPVWGKLAVVKRGGSLLFLRYLFDGMQAGRET